MTEQEKPRKMSRRLWWPWFFVVPFFVVEAGISIAYYFHEQNHSNEGFDVLLECMRFSLYFAVPAGLLGLVIAGLIYFILDQRKK